MTVNRITTEDNCWMRGCLECRAGEGYKVHEQLKAKRLQQLREEFHGELLSLLEISERSGVLKATLWYRMRHMGLSAAEAVARSTGGGK